MKIQYAQGFQDSMDRIFHWKYGPLRAWKWFIRIPREIKWLYQRMTRGWADSDVWSLDSYLAPLIRDALKELQKDKHGIPSQFCGEFVMNPDTKIWGHTRNDDEARAEWDSVLDKMIQGFDAVALQDDCTHENWEPLEKRRIEGMELFVKHFHSLWN